MSEERRPFIEVEKIDPNAMIAQMVGYLLRNWVDHHGVSLESEANAANARYKIRSDEELGNLVLATFLLDSETVGQGARDLLDQYLQLDSVESKEPFIQDLISKPLLRDPEK